MKKLRHPRYITAVGASNEISQEKIKQLFQLFEPAHTQTYLLNEMSFGFEKRGYRLKGIAETHVLEKWIKKEHTVIRGIFEASFTDESVNQVLENEFGHSHFSWVELVPIPGESVTFSQEYHWEASNVP